MGCDLKYVFIEKNKILDDDSSDDRYGFGYSEKQHVDWYYPNIGRNIDIATGRYSMEDMLNLIKHNINVMLVKEEIRKVLDGHDGYNKWEDLVNVSNLDSWDTNFSHWDIMRSYDKIITLMFELKIDEYDLKKSNYKLSREICVLSGITEGLDSVYDVIIEND